MRADQTAREGLFKRSVDAIFGYDFFLSYSHSDGKAYPRQLKQRLEAAGFKVFLDQTEYVAGDSLVRETRRQVRKSRKIIIIARPAALRSEWVRREVEAGLDDGKIPVILNINRAVETTDPSARLATMARERHWLRLEEQIEDADGQPSDTAVLELVRGFNHTRQETKRTRVFASAAAIYALLGIGAGLAAIEAYRQRETALAEKARAETNEREATRQKGFAQTNETLAKDNERRAVTELRKSQRSESLVLAEQSMRETEGGNAIGAMRLALNALPKDLAAPERPFVPRAELALSKAFVSNRLVRTIKPSKDWVNAALATPDGQSLFTGTRDGQVALWRTGTGERVWSFQEARAAVWSLALSADNKQIAIAYSDPASIVIREVESGRKLWDFSTGKITAEKLMFMPAGNQLISVGGLQDSKPRVWDLKTGKVARVLNHGLSRDAFTLSAIIDPNGGRLLTVSRGVMLGGFLTWDIGSSEPKLQHYNRIMMGDVDNSPYLNLPGDKNEAIGGAVFIEGGAKILLVGRRTAYVIDAGSGAVAANWPILAVEKAGRTDVLQVSPDGKSFLTAVSDTELAIFSLTDGKPVSSIKGHTGRLIDAAFSPDSRSVATAAEDGSVRLWEVTSGREVAVMRGHESRIKGLFYLADGRQLVSYGDRTLRIWDAQNNADRVAPRWPSGTITKRASPDGTYAVITKKTADKVAETKDLAPSIFGSADMQLLDLKSGRAISSLGVGDNSEWGLDGVVFAESAPVFLLGRAATFFNEDFKVDVIDATTGQRRRTLTPKGGAALLSPDGTIAVFTSYSYGEDKTEGVTTAEVWNAVSGEKLLDMQQLGQEPIAMLGSDNSHIALVSRLKQGSYEERQITLWDITAKTRIAELQRRLEKPNEDVRFLANGSRLLIAGKYRPPLLLDTGTGKPLGTFGGSHGVAQGARVSFDGSRVLVSKKDAPATLWDVANAKMLAEIPGPSVSITWSVFSSDGQRIVAREFDAGKSRYDFAAFSAATGRKLRDLGNFPDDAIYEMSPSGKIFAIAAAAGQVELFDTERDGEPSRKIAIRQDIAQFWFPSDNRLATIDSAGTLTLWNAETAQPEGTIEGILANDEEAPGPILAFASKSGGAVIVETMTGRAKCQIAAWRGIRTLALSADGGTVAALLTDRVGIASAQTGEVLSSLPIDSGAAVKFVTAPLGNRLLIQVSGATSTLIDSQSGKTVERFSRVQEAIFAGPASQLLLIATSGTLDVYETDHGTLKRSIPIAQPVKTLVADPNGEAVALVAKNGTVLVHELASGRELLKPGQFQYPYAAFGPDKSRFLVHGNERPLTLLSTDDGRVLSLFSTPWNSASDASGWSVKTDQKGAYMAVRSPDNTIFIHQSADGGFIEDVVWSGASIEDYEFSPDGRLLALATSDGRLAFWETGKSGAAATLTLQGQLRKEYETPLLAWSSDGEQVTAVDTDGRVACGWSAKLDGAPALHGPPGKGDSFRGFQ